MSLLGLLLLLGMAPPQDSLTPLTPGELAQKHMLYQARQARPRDHIQIERLQSNESNCFAIRSYIFKREDGQPPVLVGTTTCTPSNRLRQWRVGHPKGSFVLLNFAPGN